MTITLNHTIVPAHDKEASAKFFADMEAQAHFGWLAMFATHDLQASSAITRKKLGWNPTGPGLIADLEQMRYHETDIVGASAARRA
jgi:hypothetical protein